MQNKFGNDLSVGSIPKHLVKLALPMFIGNFLNTGYSFINTVWVGHTIGDNAVGASGVSFPIIFLLIAVASGFTMATSILVAQNFGAKNMDNVKKVVNNSFALSFFCGLLLTAIGIFFSDQLLMLMNTPKEMFELASGYLKISLLSFVFMFMSFLISSILRGIGDTVTPLIFLAFSTILNAILDPFLIIGIGPFPKLGLNGAAYATLISSGTAFICGLIYLYKKGHVVFPDFKNFKFDTKIIGLILKIGLPSMVQQSLVSIGMFIITGFVNFFGPNTTAAFTSGGRIDMIAMMPAMSLSMATSSMVGQNLGACKPERVKAIFNWGIRIGLMISVVIFLIAFIFPHFILSLFGLSKETLDIGVNYLRIVSIGYVIFTVMFVSNGVINGSGATIATMLFSLISLWVVRVPLAYYLSRFTELKSNGIWISITVSFTFTTIISLLYYFSGKWKNANKKINKENAPICNEIIE